MWIYSYADLVTLLMAFFVIIIMVKTSKPETVQKIADSFAKATGQASTIPPGMDRVITELSQILKNQAAVAVTKTTQGVSLSFMGGLFFETLSAELSQSGQEILRTLAPVIAKMPRGYRVDVGGHSDNRPVTDDSMYPSNWELSAARAAAVVRFLVTTGVPAKRLRAIGYADTVPISSNIDLNRRVVIKIGKGLTE